MKSDHLNYILDKVDALEPAALKKEVFEMLAGNNKFNQPELRQRITAFFWRVITNSDDYNADLVEVCIEKFNEFYTNKSTWQIDDVRERIILFSQELSKRDGNSVLPLIRLFKKIFERVKRDEDRRKSKNPDAPVEIQTLAALL